MLTLKKKKRLNYYLELSGMIYPFKVDQEFTFREPLREE